MKCSNSVRKSKNRYAAIAALCFGLSVAGSVQAQWTVTDPGHTMATLEGWGVQGAEIVEQAKRWQAEYAHYKQQLADAQSVFKSQGMAMTMDFNERPLDYSMAETCPGTKKKGVDLYNPDTVVSDAINTATNAISSWNPLKLDSSANLKKDMLTLCQQIVTAQNMKYNETIRLLKNIKQRDDELNKVEGYRQRVGTSQGKMATSSNQIGALSARLQMDIQYAETVIKAYDEHIGNLKLDQEKISERILKGGGNDKNMVSSLLLQGAALKGTFAGMSAIRDR